MSYECVKDQLDFRNKATQFGMPTLIEIERLEDTARLCRKLGLQFIELNMNLPQYQVESLKNIAYFKNIAEQYHIFYTIHLDENLNVADFNRAVSKAYLDTVKQTIEVAARLEVPVLNMHLNPGVHFTLPDRKVALFEQYQDQYLKSMERFRSMCEEEIGHSDIRICIENTDGFQDFEKDIILMLLESPVFGLTWDIGHSYVAGERDQKFLMGYLQKLKHFHIHDAVDRSNHLMLGTGEIDLANRLSLAHEVGARCVVETKTVSALEGSVAWLRNMGYLTKETQI